MKKKSKNEQMKELKSALHFFQMRGRIYRQWTKDVNTRVKEIAEKMRELQNENQKTIPTRLHDDGIQIQEEQSRV